MNNSNHFTANFASQVEIAIDPQYLTKVQSEAKDKMPNATAQQNYIVNSLCLAAASEWLEENILESDEAIAIPEKDYLEARWSVVQGTELVLDTMKIVVIPQESSDIAGISVPREWLDIPQWIPDYFLAVQVDLEQQVIWLWGYVHSNTIKRKGTLDRTHQHYSLPLEQMSLDLELFGITHQLVEAPQKSQDSIVEHNINRQKALTELSKPSPFSPRLALPFVEWTTLISDKQWCREFYQERIQISQSKEQITTSSQGKEQITTSSQSKEQITKLLQWLKSEVTSTLDTGWYELNKILPVRQSPLAFALRNNELELKEWVKKAKVIDLKVQLQQARKIILLIALTQKAENQYSIVAQLHPDTEQNYVPEAIGFQILYDNEVLQEVNARSQDRYLQIGFTSPIETSFSIKVTSHQQVCFEEEFVL